MVRSSGRAGAVPAKAGSSSLQCKSYECVFGGNHKAQMQVAWKPKYGEIRSQNAFRWGGIAQEERLIYHTAEYTISDIA